MTVYKMRRTKREPQVKSISTLWLVAVVAIVYAAGFLANLV